MLRKKEKQKFQPAMTFRKCIHKYGAYYLMLIPLLACLIIFCYFPMVGISYAFTDYSPFHKELNFIGLENFQKLFASDGFWQAFKNTLEISTIRLLLVTFGSIGLALLLDEIGCMWFRKLTQTMVYIPHFMSWVVVASIFTIILSPQKGMVNSVIKALGGKPIYFLANRDWWRPWLYIISVWKEMGWGAIIYVSALAGVDMEQHEAATVDGANRIQRVIHVTLPAISGTIMVVFILNLAKILNLFDPVWVLQNSMVIKVSDVIETYVYRMGISSSQYGISTAAGLFKSVVSVIFVIAGNKISQKITGEGVI
ncbi:MAG: sugar ABC transporter permease [Lachnospiraceae bacterium]|nr:sugar ABC transporter permease [Lachnospiraceae bacterium]